MVDERVAPRGRYRVVIFVNARGPYYGETVYGDYDSLGEARAAAREAIERWDTGDGPFHASYSSGIYDEKGDHIG